MKNILLFLFFTFLLGTLFVLAVGIFGMFRTKSNPELSNKLMRLRIVFQALTVLCFMGLLYLDR